MRKRPFYSVRTGKHKGPRAFDLAVTKKLFLGVFEELEADGFFQEHFGFWCIDAGHVPGTFGSNIAARILLELGKGGVWPIDSYIGLYTEDDLFDMIELLHEYVSEPTQKEYHSWNDCGWHCSAFIREPGQKRFRDRINDFLPHYSTGFTLNNDGEVVSMPDSGMEELEDAVLPRVDPRDAVRDLADVLEFLRPQVKSVLTSKDESDLFHLINNFGIRHHTTQQKTDYDPAIWQSWMYYFLLATIHAAVRLIEKVQSPEP
jgi:hypothetical protein